MRMKCSTHLQLALMLACVGLAGRSAQGQDGSSGVPGGAKALSVLELQPHHMTISVQDLRSEKDWYIEKLGFSEAPMGAPPGSKQAPPPFNPNMKGGAQLKIPGYRIDLIQYAGSERSKIPSPRYLAQGWVHIAFSVVDVQKALDFLQSAGTDVTANREPGGALRGLLLHDPEGNEIELFPR